ncbi:MAG: DUF1854 domain-containing protein [Myxococcota bacterium]
MKEQTMAQKPESEEVELRLERRADGQLWAVLGLEAVPVWVHRCFPWTAPGRFVSLRDQEEEEVALVRDLSELEPESRRVLQSALLEAGFVLEVESVESIEDEIEIRTFRVRTRQGPRRFQTLRDEWPRPMPGGGILLRDVAGDLYLVRDPEALDRASRDRLWPLLD